MGCDKIMGTYITVATVRRTCGIESAEINDTDVEAVITEVESQVPRYFNTVFVPTEKIEVRDGDGTNRIILHNNPVLSVRELKIDGSTEDPANLNIYKGSGKIELSTSATSSTFTYGSKKIAIKYIYGFLEESSTSTTTSAAEVAGTDVSVAVGSITGFADNDWIEIYGMDGHREVAQINGTPALGAIILDKLVQTHESGSTVVKLEISTNFKKLMNLIAGIALVARIVGASYDEITGYNISEFRVQKGEPYTQWRETANQFIRERDELMKIIKPRPCIM